MRTIKIYGGPQDGLQGVQVPDPLPDFWVHDEANNRESVYEHRIGSQFAYDYIMTRTRDEEVSTDEEVRDRTDPPRGQS